MRNKKHKKDTLSLPDFHRRLWIQTRSTPIGSSRAYRNFIRFTAGGDFHPALRMTGSVYHSEDPLARIKLKRFTPLVFWRKRVRIELTEDGLHRPPRGFEARGAHQDTFASDKT